ncbi:amidohydrolase family protein [Candidimonas nitroreducens]|uniref:Amidohydrolase n=1 Tax=Candidimonas nitroreducens TaxID=683354 RepID=A0A225M8V9_9BURK|nr:amidohydrolase family protein [Candidimonas nitroreducens]OWT57556.1 amidohydrolase [Candidimonas nitroreducens]
MNNQSSPSAAQTIDRASTVIDPHIKVVDSHHHLWLKAHQRYLIEDFEADLSQNGHVISGTVYVECHSGYRQGGDPAKRSVGEAQFYAWEKARGQILKDRKTDGFVGAVDLTIEERVEEVLDEMNEECGGKLKGIRGAVYWNPDPSLNLGLRPYSPKGLLLDAAFRRGFSYLAKTGLVYDAWQYEPQLPELCDLADHFGEAVIVVNHCGGPLGINAYATSDRFSRWRSAIEQVAARPNTFMKLSGLTAPRIGIDLPSGRPDAETLATRWKPYIDACIEAFSPSRCLFGSNFPVDLAVCSYRDLINVYKLATASYSNEERNAIFSGTANRVYNLGA